MFMVDDSQSTGVLVASRQRREDNTRDHRATGFLSLYVTNSGKYAGNIRVCTANWYVQMTPFPLFFCIKRNVKARQYMLTFNFKCTVWDMGHGTNSIKNVQKQIFPA